MKNGIPNYNEIIFTKDEKDKIVELYIKDELSTPKIGLIMGCNYGKICSVLDEYGIKRKKQRTKKIFFKRKLF